jgi:uncharacterized DUF497 family protein
MTAPVGERSDYQFEWDEKKNRQNIRKHGFDFVDAEEMFAASFSSRPTFERTTEKAAGLGSARFAAALRSWSFTERGPTTIRIISLRKATRRESKQYEKAVQDQLETG